MHAVKLFWDDPIDPKVISLEISSPDCDIVTFGDLSQVHQDVAQRKFRINKAKQIEMIHLYVSAKVKLITSKDLQFTLKIEPIVKSESEYSLETIWAYDTKYTFMIAAVLSIADIVIIVLAVVGSFLLITALVILIHYKILPRYIVEDEDIVYVINDFGIPEDY
ncbi:hypothetical protein RF11_03530 [Thelohanellus kitauei]|uniref:Uncharacterized protein n=1 Tax=Thelohanellus kitauei TaxID=669202 RepID=A0A0C2IMS9_THEKT|nr:hypothetical protein RF11_03530 [Thelohanellus kitauei]